MLSNSSQCLPCPAGLYCTNGFISGECSAGCICWSGSWLHNPESTGLIIVPETVGSLCPAGHYCPTGIKYPIPCNNFTIKTPSAGGRQLSDCLPCPAGYICTVGSSTTSYYLSCWLLL